MSGIKVDIHTQLTMKGMCCYHFSWIQIIFVKKNSLKVEILIEKNMKTFLPNA